MSETFLEATTASGDAAAIIESTRAATLAAAEPTEIAPHVLSTLVPDGYQLVETDLERYQDAPRRRIAKVTLDTTESLVQYLARHGNEATALYADPSRLSVQAVIDDDVHRGHSATLILKRTIECARWFGAHSKYMDQEAFAQLVEDGLGEIARPAGADLLELAQSMHASSSASFRSGLRLQDGRVQFSYVEEIDARAGADGQMTIPATITLVFAPFEGASDMQIEARLRYRIGGGKLTLGVWLIDGEQAIRTAFDDEIDRIDSSSSFRPLIGSSGV